MTIICAIGQGTSKPWSMVGELFKQIHMTTHIIPTERHTHTAFSITATIVMDMKGHGLRYVLHATSPALLISASSTSHFNECQPFNLKQKSLAGKMVKSLWVFCSTLQNTKPNEVLIFIHFLTIMIVGKDEANTARNILYLKPHVKEKNNIRI